MVKYLCPFELKISHILLFSRSFYGNLYQSKGIYFQKGRFWVLLVLLKTCKNRGLPASYVHLQINPGRSAREYPLLTGGRIAC